MYKFGMGDLEIESANTITGRVALWSMLAIFTLASAATTYSFFATYSPGLGAALHSGFAGIVSGALGVVLFDLAGLGWTVLRSSNSDTNKQFWIATAAAIVTIGLSLVASGMYVLLSTSFNVGLYDAAGRLTDFGQVMHIAGVVVMTAGFVLNFGCIAAYVNTGKSVTKAVQDRKLAAYVTQGRFVADQARAQLVTEQTLQGIMRALPSMAAEQGRWNTMDYVEHAFGNVDDLLAIDGTPPKPEELPEDAPPGAFWTLATLGGKQQWVMAFPPVHGVNGEGEDSPLASERA